MRRLAMLVGGMLIVAVLLVALIIWAAMTTQLPEGADLRLGSAGLVSPEA